MIELAQVKDISVIAGVIIAVITLVKAVFEYKRQGAQKRAEYFLQFRKQRIEHKSFERIRLILDQEEGDIDKLTLIEKEEFLAFFEDIA